MRLNISNPVSTFQSPIKAEKVAHHGLMNVEKDLQGRDINNED